MLDLKRIKVFPLAERESLSQIGDILVNPDTPPPACPAKTMDAISQCARHIREARKRGAGVMLIYGAHLIKNGGATLLTSLLSQKHVTHLATNGAGSIHDWEFAFQGWSTESVEKNVKTGTFGTWNETGRYIQLALQVGALSGLGYGASLGKFVCEDGTTLPTRSELEKSLRDEPAHPLAPARAELLQTMLNHPAPPGRLMVRHPWKRNSVSAQAYAEKVPFTVHPGIGYDIITNHPMYCGGAVGRGAAIDFNRFCDAVETLDGGVVLSIGSAIMAPQVFEKSMSCVNNLRLQEGRAIVRDHQIYVVDLQDGGGWDWKQGEPPRDNPAYYLRFCKSYSRMGGDMTYVQCDNTIFLHNLISELNGESEADE